MNSRNHIGDESDPGAARHESELRRNADRMQRLIDGIADPANQTDEDTRRLALSLYIGDQVKSLAQEWRGSGEDTSDALWMVEQGSGAFLHDLVSGAGERTIPLPEELQDFFVEPELRLTLIPYSSGSQQVRLTLPFTSADGYGDTFDASIYNPENPDAPVVTTPVLPGKTVSLDMPTAAHCRLRLNWHPALEQADMPGVSAQPALKFAPDPLSAPSSLTEPGRTPDWILLASLQSAQKRGAFGGQFAMAAEPPKDSPVVDLIGEQEALPSGGFQSRYTVSLQEGEDDEPGSLDFTFTVLPHQTVQTVTVTACVGDSFLGRKKAHGAGRSRRVTFKSADLVIANQAQIRFAFSLTSPEAADLKK